MTDQPVPYGGPAAPQPSSTYAEWGDRVIATLWDFVYMLPPMVGIALGAVTTVIGAVLLGDDRASGPAVLTAGIAVTMAAVVWHVVRFIRNSFLRQGRTGQTWGKARTGIWVLQEAGGTPPGAWSCVGRWLLHGIINQAVYLDYLWPLWDEKNQTLTDKILSTVVVKRTA